MADPATTTAAIKTLTVFERYGLAGLTIGALFIVIFAFMRFLHKKDQDHINMTQKIMDDSREERKHLHDSHKESNDKLAKALDDLTNAIRRKN